MHQREIDSDNQLEKRNFEKAGEILAEIWSKTVIDGHVVDAKALPPGKEVKLRRVTQSGIEV